MPIFSHRPVAVNQVVLLPVDEIRPSPNQPRSVFDPAELASLARSIAENGQLVPISVRRVDDGYELIAGERRLLACKALGRSEIAAIVERKDELSAASLTLIENLHRKDLDCFEEAQGIAALMERCGLSQSEVCRILAKPQSTVANKLRLLKLEPQAAAMARGARLPERCCRALLTLPTQSQLAACRAMIERGMNAEQAEAFVAALTEHKPPPRRRTAGVLRDFRLLLGPMDRAVEEIKRSGVTVTVEKLRRADCICYNIRIPVASRPSDPESAVAAAR